MDNNNIIPFPTALAVGGESPTNAPAQAASEVIDFADHPQRRPSNATATDDRPSDIDPFGSLLRAIEVWDALKENRLAIHYQPQYDLDTGKTIAAEALVRLINSDGQLIYPERFIDLVERSDLIVPLGRAVISQVCADLAASRAQGIELRRIAINLAARQLGQDAQLLEFIDLEIARFGLQYADLEFELTERQQLAPDSAGIAQLNALAERGARIVLDDFGIGYSSVMYLTELPIAAFKLDRALISRLPEDQATRSVVASLLALATELDLQVIAEGIETPEQFEFLERAGCPYGQGFGYAKPMDIGDLQAFLANDRDGSQSIHARVSREPRLTS